MNIDTIIVDTNYVDTMKVEIINIDTISVEIIDVDNINVNIIMSTKLTSNARQLECTVNFQSVSCIHILRLFYR